MDPLGTGPFPCRVVPFEIADWSLFTRSKCYGFLFRGMYNFQITNARHKGEGSDARALKENERVLS
jgi:hypothetical protein